MKNDKKVTVLIDNLRYTLPIGKDKDGLVEEMLYDLLPKNKNFSVKELLIACLKQTINLHDREKSLKKLLTKISNV